jgi:hypothetical protein
MGAFDLDLDAYPAAEGFKFHGFAVPKGHYIIGFNLETADIYTLPAFTDFELGHTTGVPEPASWLLMILGFGAAGAMLRSGKAREARAA